MTVLTDVEQQHFEAAVLRVKTRNELTLSLRQIKRQAIALSKGRGGKEQHANRIVKDSPIGKKWNHHFVAEKSIGEIGLLHLHHIAKTQRSIDHQDPNE